MNDLTRYEKIESIATIAIFIIMIAWFGGWVVSVTHDLFLLPAVIYGYCYTLWLSEKKIHE